MAFCGRPDSELGFEGCMIFRCDRNSNTSKYTRGEGTLIAVKNDELVLGQF